MLLDGGQIAMALSYSLSLLIFYLFLKILFAKKKLIASLLLGLLLSLQIIYDPRVTYIMFIGLVICLFVYVYLFFDVNKRIISPVFNIVLYGFIIPGSISLLIHFFWLFPTFMLNQNPIKSLGISFSSAGAVRFFSFAQFENSISLLHPNWYENIFGKVSFMRPEFIFFPLLAYGALIFIKTGGYSVDKKKNFYIITLCLFSIIGTFFAKGTNEPFGGIYLWLFEHFPGFMLFRDSTKWYILIALAYSLLIPLTIQEIVDHLKRWIQINKNISFLYLHLAGIFFISFICIFLFIINPVVLGKLQGVFKQKTIPREYIQLKDYLTSQASYFRTLWMPRIQRFGYYSDMHPAINSQEFFEITALESLMEKLQEDDSKIQLQEAAIKYIIVPFDSEEEVFLTDRRYDVNKYKNTIERLQKITWLKEIKKFNKVRVFEVKNPKKHFSSTNSNIQTKDQYISSAKYIIKVINAKKCEQYDLFPLIFSE